MGGPNGQKKKKKKLKKWTCGATSPQAESIQRVGFCALAYGYPTPGPGPTRNFYIDISVVLECLFLFIKEETFEIKKVATQSN